MNVKLKELCSVALALLIGTGAVTLTYRNGRTETISYKNWGEEAPCLLEGAFVESVICHNPVTFIA